MDANADDDLEDGEIEDDDEDEIVPESAEKKTIEIKITPELKKKETPEEKKKRHDKKKLTEAEKSVMRLHKIERHEREKRNKYTRHTTQEEFAPPAEEDFATTLERAIASVLKKDKPPSDEEAIEGGGEADKRGKKRKKKDKHNKKSKKSKQESPKLDEIDENELLNIRGGSPDATNEIHPHKHPEEDDQESDSSSSKTSERRPKNAHKQSQKQSKPAKNEAPSRGNKRKKKFRDRTVPKDDCRKKWEQAQQQAKRNTGVCLYFLQGMCSDDNCQYSHESIQPMKLELCKFYLLDCCAKGDKCLYMHSDFPCKFYHTGIPCPMHDKCKFAHGGPLSDGLKQILFKHIETAPKEILGNFPRLSRENASVMIHQSQNNLEIKYGLQKKESTNQENNGNKCVANIPSLFDLSFNQAPENQDNSLDMRNDNNKKDNNKRNRPSRWQDPEPISDMSLLQDQQKAIQMQLGFNPSKTGFQDQDMRVNNNGDVDMRSLGIALPPQSIHPTNIVNPNILAQTSQPPPMLPPQITPNVIIQQIPIDIEKYKLEAGLMHGDTDIRTKDVDVRLMPDVEAVIVEPPMPSKDVDHRLPPPPPPTTTSAVCAKEEVLDEEEALQIVEPPEIEAPLAETAKGVDEVEDFKADPYFDRLPKAQRELFMRIQSQQKANYSSPSKCDSDNEESNINWYSDDEDDNKLTIKDDFEDAKMDEDLNEMAQIEPQEVIEKLGDLSKIDISAEVSKLLSTISQSTHQQQQPTEIKTPAISSPKAASEPRADPRNAPRSPRGDPRKNRINSNEEKPPQIAPTTSIYDQGNLADFNRDVDLRTVDQDLRQQLRDTDLRPESATTATSGRSDIDLRQMGLPFKAMQNYTPATEIDASISSHPPLVWRVAIVDVPKPDYTGLKLSAAEAETTGDPRLRKIFRLSIDDDSPASPKTSPKSSPKQAVPAAQTRVDPRRRKLDGEVSVKPEVSGGLVMTYAQQVSMLQASPFYQTLTSNQKLALNQELAMKSGEIGQNEPIIATMLQNLGLITNNAPPTTQAINLLANFSQLGVFPPVQASLLPASVMIGPNAILPPQLGNQGLLGAAPGLPNLQNMPPDFNINFDPRNGGLLGSGPPPFAQFVENNFDNSQQFGGANFNNDNDFFPEQQQQQQHYNNNNNNGGNNSNRDNNRGYRDRPRRGGRNNNNNNNHNNHRNNRNNNNFRNRSRNNRNNSPP